jgi:hypothetical protein
LAATAWQMAPQDPVERLTISLDGRRDSAHDCIGVSAKFIL